MDVPGLPVTVLLDRDGAEIARMLGGADWNGPEAHAVIDALIAANSHTRRCSARAPNCGYSARGTALPPQGGSR